MSFSAFEWFEKNKITPDSYIKLSNFESLDNGGFVPRIKDSSSNQEYTYLAIDLSKGNQSFSFKPSEAGFSTFQWRGKQIKDEKKPEKETKPEKSEKEKCKELINKVHTCVQKFPELL
ncbi:hypothetical protein EV182_003765 [Spiromyces aspiralis]|uniref:Uncharacterized protein n=1 Tax=Spiromyces aspiralis TaxID=68401 RepID=A0ACC1HFR4_9FUNG|nr:hypothetical protein EV182_003765 [Spiromyces aspiralis]